MNEEFQHVSLLLQEPLSDEPEQLIKDLEAIEVWNTRMQFLLAEKSSYLDKENFRLFPSEGTESSKKISLKFYNHEIQEEKDKIEGLCEAIKTRITLGQSILKYYSSTNNIHY